MKKLAILSLLIIITLCISCKGKNNSDEVLPPPDITGFGAKKNRDSVCVNSKFINYYFANNTLIIVGKNLGSDGNVDISDNDIDIIDVNWSNERVTITTKCDDYKEFAPVKITLQRVEDDAEVSTTENFVSDISGYAYQTPVFYLIEYLKTLKLSVYEDFTDDFTPVISDYEPTVNDLIQMPNGEYRIITEILDIAANGSYRSVQFYSKRWDCYGREEVQRNIFYALTSQGTVRADTNTPVKYLQL